MGVSHHIVFPCFSIDGKLLTVLKHLYGASRPWGGLRHFPAIWKPKTNDAAPKLGALVNIFTYLTLANNEYLPIKLMLQTYVTMCCIFSHLQCP